MKIKHRYVFRSDSSEDKIIQFLNKNNIKYENSSGLIVLEVYEHQEHWPEIKDLMKPHEITSMSQVIYSKNELNKAKWLVISPKGRAEYPQPEDDFEYERITYDSTNSCSLCKCGLVQKDSFRVKKTPAWGKKNFLRLYWVEDEIFTNNTAVEKLKASNLRGFSIKEVKHYKTHEPFFDIYQIRVDNYLKEGLIFKSEDIKKENHCTECHSTKWVLAGTRLYQIKNEILKDIHYDIVKTAEKFGDGGICSSLIIISDRMYDFLKQNNWDKEFYFEPVTVV